MSVMSSQSARKIINSGGALKEILSAKNVELFEEIISAVSKEPDYLHIIAARLRDHNQRAHTIDEEFPIPDLEALIGSDGDEYLEALDGLIRHTIEHDAPGILTYVNHKNSFTLETGFQTQQGYVCWSRNEYFCDDHARQYVYLSTDFDSSRYKISQKQNSRSYPAFYRYHPERFRFHHDFAMEFLPTYRKNHVPDSGALIGQETLQSLYGMMVQEVNKKALRIPLFPRYDESHLIGIIFDNLFTLTTSYCRFHTTGKQIFEVPQHITDLLSKTDVSEVPLEEITLPFPCQYIYFGPQKDLTLSGRPVDGAYIESRGGPGKFSVTVTTCPPEGFEHLMDEWPVNREPAVHRDFVGDEGIRTLKEAVTKEFGSVIERLEEFSEGGPVAKMQRAVPDAMPQIRDISADTAAIRKAIAQDENDSFVRALHLCVNIICYLTAYGDDISEEWPDHAPKDLVDLLKNAGPKEVRSIERKLQSSGYVKVKLIGKRFKPVGTLSGKRDTDHGKRTAHWRKGHWRNQVHGVGRLQRKLLWIMPMLINSNDEDIEPKGHIYLVD